MKTSGHLILYISENEDFELWKILTQISPEERTAFVKSALQRALTSNSSKTTDYSINNTHSIEKRQSTPPVNVEGFNQQTAAAKEPEQKDEEQLQFDELFLSAEVTDSTSPPGLDFLLNNVIGEEDDEMVIEFIKNRITVDE